MCIKITGDTRIEIAGIAKTWGAVFFVDGADSVGELDAIIGFWVAFHNADFLMFSVMGNRVFQLSALIFGESFVIDLHRPAFAACVGAIRLKTGKLGNSLGGADFHD